MWHHAYIYYLSETCVVLVFNSIYDALALSVFTNTLYDGELITVENHNLNYNYYAIKLSS